MAANREYSDPPSPNARHNMSQVESTRLLPSPDPASPPPPGPPSPNQAQGFQSNGSGSGNGGSLTSRPSRMLSTTASFVSSPLNPSSPSTGSQPNNPFASARSSRPGSRASNLDAYYNNNHPPSAYPTSPTPSKMGLGMGMGMAGMGGSRGSMVLYRLATEEETRNSFAASMHDSHLLPPRALGANRDSTVSSSGSSVMSDQDSKYPYSRDSAYPFLPAHASPLHPDVNPAALHRDPTFPSTPRGLVPYAYDPAMDELDPIDDEDLLHDPKTESKGVRLRTRAFPWRGLLNVTALIVLVLALLCLFIFYPVLTFYRSLARNNRIDGNIRINATGQAPVLFQMPDMIDNETSEADRTRIGFDGQEYELVFSDEFNTPGRSFYPGDDPFWEAVDLWYGATADVEWYDPSQVTTRDGALVITMDSVDTLTGGLTPGSTAPFTLDQNHGLSYRSGMLQSWNKFCFTSGYIEVAVVLPGPNENTQGYWPGAWTMGNLARPGYPATTDGMWPYTYDSCDVGTFPNQTNKDRLGPAAALHSDSSRSRYNYELSWLSGQRLSACSCPGSDHPGPRESKGRGAPEIDIFEAEKDKDNAQGHVVSQSAQFAPFTHDYLYGNATTDQWQIFTPDITRPNSYRGSAVQQAVSGIVKLPPDMFQGSGKVFKKLGFEYWANPSNVQEGYITWQVDQKQSHRVGASAVGPDQGEGGSGIGQRLIPEEPMSIVLNLGMSPNWQTIDVSSMQFPSEFLIDYVRVYQRKGQTNVGCDPKDYPTAQYINQHKEAYQNVNMTTWNWPKPKNSLYDGC